MAKELVGHAELERDSGVVDERDLADQFIETFLALDETDGSEFASLKDVATNLSRSGHQFAGLIIRNTVLRWENDFPQSPHVEIDDGLIHKPLSRIVIVDGNEVKLSPRENRLLFYFRTHPNVPISGYELESVFNSSGFAVIISRVRKKN